MISYCIYEVFLNNNCNIIRLASGDEDVRRIGRTVTRSVPWLFLVVFGAAVNLPCIGEKKKQKKLHRTSFADERIASICYYIALDLHRESRRSDGSNSTRRRPRSGRFSCRSTAVPVTSSRSRLAFVFIIIIIIIIFSVFFCSTDFPFVLYRYHRSSA